MEKKIGLSKTPPKNEARPLGTPRPKVSAAKQQKVVDTQTAVEVGSPQSPIPAQTGPYPMTLTLKSLSKNGKRAIYNGAAQTFQIPLGAFVGKTAPPEFAVQDGIFAEKAVQEPKQKMTAEERKAANALKPKLTLAERAAKAKERADKLAAQVAKQGELVTM